MRPNSALAATLCLAVLGVAAAGCGGSGDDDATTQAGAATEEPTTSSPADGEGASAKLPAALATNRAEANEIIDEGTEALDAKLAKLEGHPVVVNQWGSWCPPCRAEFPYFQQAAEEYADSVAFLGIDMTDERGAAEQFLEDFPVPYPSIWDPDAEAIVSLGGGVVSPTTVYVDEKGEVVDVWQGEYTSVQQIRDAVEENFPDASRS